MESHRKPTTREIAKAIGLSQSTVSHALRGTNNVSAKTRERIIGLAKEMGWESNPYASAYMAHLRRTKQSRMRKANIALLLFNPSKKNISAQLKHIQRHYHGAQQCAEELGFGLEPMWLNEAGLTGQRLTSIMRARNVSGIIVPGVEAAGSVLEGLNWSLFASVSMGFLETDPPLHRVTSDTVSGFHHVLQRIIGMGYARVGVAVSESYDKQVNHGVCYAASYVRDFEQGNSKVCVLRYHSHNADSITSIRKWVEKFKPDIILGEDFTLRAIKAIGLKIAEDIAFANVDWSPDFPQIAGFNQRHELHGSSAVRLLAAQIVDNNLGIPEVPQTILIPGQWEDGKSAPPLKLKSA